MPCDFYRIVKIWQGFDGFRQILGGVRKIGADKIEQSTINTFFPGQGLSVRYIPRKELYDSIIKQLESPDLHDLMRAELEGHKRLLMEVKDDLILERSTEEFDYEFIFKGAEPSDYACKGFAKAKSKVNPYHAALLSWEDASEPIFFLAELEIKQLRFHIDYGSAGFALIEELAEGFRWTHSAKSNYAALSREEFGSVMMSRADGKFALEQGNLAAAQALNRAKAVGRNGKTLLENNVDLMKMYKADLERLVY